LGYGPVWNFVLWAPLGNVFAIESFMDELAEIVGADAVDYRPRHLNDERARAVIQSVANRAQKVNGTRARNFLCALRNQQSVCRFNR
jgi:CO/xanthine dehydrogenase Mo-binding subunit